ncbi:5'-methylthioadenosine/adenosylhomocysteine nucleosidase [Buchnera aphidicola (Hyadaphis tataricae)]|uniref:adenosylhomocysteine nucleosidase n=1 Tax=Buchnera aphidicola (Hyadaphis tataricae) TaxID=1241859 RepID=A0A4D6Y661_9GAMM|nr:5'-methylthioadenosine/adenosylhomocysteine nucleosidase [Buchnera aphidicola]QCI21521.1 5'-methylthioadenosine/adenosylhomocysteine nucleosidase [Buchnera aphidicola (Hyadaphis tataricae)]
MKIGIIGAMHQEIQIIKNIIKPYHIKNLINSKIYIGMFKTHEIFLIQSGIGKVSAAIACMTLIQLCKIDLIINSGSAGGLIKTLSIGDLIVPKKICYYDVNLKNFGYSLGQIPTYPKFFRVNNVLFNFFKEVSKQFQLPFYTGIIVSGDSFVRKKVYVNQLKHHFSSAVAVDMESAAIGQVCYKFNIPFIVIKSISDASDNSATVNFKKNIDIASLQSSNFVKIILENIITI